MFVIYGAMTGTSIGRLFLGGVVPGLIMAPLPVRRRLYHLEAARISEAAGSVVARSLAHHLEGPAGAAHAGDRARRHRRRRLHAHRSRRDRGRSMPSCSRVFVYREVKWHDIIPMMAQAATLTAAVMLIVSASEPFGWILARERVTDALTTGFRAFTSQPWLFLASVNVALLLFGIFFEPVPLLILMTPVLMPLLAVNTASTRCISA